MSVTQQLYRITYIRKGTPCSVTFSAEDAVSAAEFVELWEKITRLPALTLQPIGQSKIPDITYKRVSQGRAPGDRPTFPAEVI